MNMLSVATYGVAMIIGSFDAFASDGFDYPPKDWGKHLKPSKGTIMVPRADVLLYPRPSTGLFFDSSALGTANRGDEFEVKDTRVLKSSRAEHYYLKVVPKQGYEALCSDGCWVYQGKAGASLPENLLPRSLIEKMSLE